MKRKNTSSDNFYTDNSYTVEVRVHPGSSKRGIALREEDTRCTIHLYTTQKPVEGRANSDAVRILSDYFGVPRGSVTLLRGEKSKNKLFLIRGNVTIDKEKQKYIREV